MCLWVDLTNPHVELKEGDTTAYPTCPYSPWKYIQCNINPSLKGLATETYDKREDQLVFWKRLPRKLKHRKHWQRSLQSRHPKSDLGIMTRQTCIVFFLSKGAPARYGSRNQRHNKPYSKPHQQFKQQQQPRGQPPRHQLQAKSSK